MSDGMEECNKHAKSEIIGYTFCPECEVMRLRAEIEKLKEAVITQDEKQTLKMKLVKTHPMSTPCSDCFFNSRNCIQHVGRGCGDNRHHFEPSTQIKIEIAEDKP